VPKKTQSTESAPYVGRSFSTKAQRAFRRSDRKRMAWAAVSALVALAALILLGPSQEAIKKRFEYYGAPGDLTIMPEISIEDGSDRVHQIPKTLMTPPPPAHIEIEPEAIDPDAEKPRPKEADNLEDQVRDWPTFEPTPAAEVMDNNQVELSLPQQSSPDWFILYQEMPEYPLTASESVQRIPVIQIRVAIFVDKEGNVTEAIIQSANASSLFTTEVLEKVRTWEFGWRVDPLAGRWIELTFNFNSPYAMTSRDNR
jgi:hypothetical protein